MIPAKIYLNSKTQFTSKFEVASLIGVAIEEHNRTKHILEASQNNALGLFRQYKKDDTDLSAALKLNIEADMSYYQGVPSFESLQSQRL